MKRARITAALGGLLSILWCPPSALSAGNPMTLVGTLAPWPAGQYSNVAADATRHVAYLGSFDDQGVAVIDTRDPANPVLTDRLSTHITSDLLTSDSADLDRVGRYLAVSHQASSAPDAFEGISVYDIGADPYHPALLRRIAIPGGVHTVQIDPEVESGRPYAYANSEGNLKVTIVNILTGSILSQYASSEGIGCVPPPPNCQGFNFAHEGFVQRHPRSGRVLDYVSYWDSGLRIVDVTDPAHPVEVGAFDYNFFTNGLTSAHYAAATPSANWVYLEDEIGLLETGGVHVLDTSTCDGSSYCTPALVGGWHIQGHPVQGAALNALIHSGKFGNALLAAFKRAFTYDAHNLDVRGENELLVANYAMGIRLVDTSDKTTPVETAFYLPNANESVACKQACGANTRQTWGSYFGSDGRIYASDLGRGFFIVEERLRGGANGAAFAGRLPAGSVGAEARAGAGGNAAGVRLRAPVGGSGANFAFSLTTTREATARIAVYDVQGRLVSANDLGSLPAGEHSVSWTPRGAEGRLPSRGIYFARVESGEGAATIKFVH
ncbi:MAG TPA: FlgD immunoglobulin-like domain containing protein [Candidatus Eisenbacteria bacterium]|nr:FlgD immunoglobulin-like domain containing protein [Candidatus Eisenbacteria bacterium]